MQEKTLVLDTSGLVCPEPIMLLHRALRKIEGGGVIEVIATDPATCRDIPNFCRHLGHELLECSSYQVLPYQYYIRKKRD